MSIQMGRGPSQLGVTHHVRRHRLASFAIEHLAWLFLILLIVVPSLTNADFRTANNIEGFLVSAGVLFILAIGESFALIIAGVDLAVGGGVALGCVLVAEFLSDGLGVALSCILTVAIITCTGVINGWAIARFGLPSFIMTFAMLAAEVSAALVISGGNRIGIDSGSPITELATGTVIGIPYQTWLALAILLIGEVFLRLTPQGRHLYAVGSNMNAARVSGVSPNRVIITAFAISAAISGVAAVVYASYTTAGDPLAAGNLNLDAIAAAVIGGVSLFGGRGSLVGGFIGAIIYELITRVLYLYGVSSNLAEVTGGVIIILAAFSNVLGARRSRA